MMINNGNNNYKTPSITKYKLQCCHRNELWWYDIKQDFYQYNHKEIVTYYILNSKMPSKAVLQDSMIVKRSISSPVTEN